jgi:peroxiredoxin
MIQAGEKAPLFKVASTRGDLDLGILVSQRPIVVYFFPKAFTPG